MWCFVFTTLRFWPSVLGLWALIEQRWPHRVCTSIFATKAKPKDQSPAFLVKLLEKSYVVFEKQTDVIEPIHERAHPIDTQSKGTARINIWINAGSTKHIGMHHSRSAELNPTRVFTNTTACAAALEATEVKLRARLCKRKVRRPEARDCLRAKH